MTHKKEYINTEKILLYNFLIKNRKYLKTIFKYQIYLFYHYNTLKGCSNRMDKSYQIYMFIIRDLLFSQELLKNPNLKNLKQNENFNMLFNFFKTIDTPDMNQKRFDGLTKIIDIFFKNNKINIKNLDTKKDSNSIFTDNAKKPGIYEFKKSMKIHLEKYLRINLDSNTIKKSLKGEKIKDDVNISNKIQSFNREYLKEKKKIIKIISDIIRERNGFNKKPSIDFETFIKNNFDNDFSYKNLKRIERANVNDEYNLDLLENDQRLNYIDNTEVNIETVFNNVEISQNMNDSNYLENVNGSNYLENTNNINDLGNINNPNYLENTNNINHLENINNMNYLENVNNQNLLSNLPIEELLSFNNVNDIFYINNLNSPTNLDNITSFANFASNYFF